MATNSNNNFGMRYTSGGRGGCETFFFFEGTHGTMSEPSFFHITSVSSEGGGIVGRGERIKYLMGHKNLLKMVKQQVIP